MTVLLRDLQTDSKYAQKTSCQANRLICQDCAVRSSTDISDSRKDCAEPEYAQKKSSHREHQQSVGDSKKQSLQSQSQRQQYICLDVDSLHSMLEK